jgi:hypothetical protein
MGFPLGIPRCSKKGVAMDFGRMLLLIKLVWRLLNHHPQNDFRKKVFFDVMSDS